MPQQEILDLLRRWNIHQPDRCLYANGIYLVDRADSLTPLESRPDGAFTSQSEDAIASAALEQLANLGALTSLWPDSGRWHLAFQTNNVVSGESLALTALQALVKVLEERQRQREVDSMLDAVLEQL